METGGVKWLYVLPEEYAILRRVLEEQGITPVRVVEFEVCGVRQSQYLFETGEDQQCVSRRFTETMTASGSPVAG